MEGLNFRCIIGDGHGRKRSNPASLEVDDINPDGCFDDRELTGSFLTKVALNFGWRVNDENAARRKSSGITTISEKQQAAEMY